MKTYIPLLALLLAGCGGSFTSAPEGSRKPPDDSGAPEAQPPAPDAPAGRDGAPPGCSCDYLTGGGCPAGQVSALCSGPPGCLPLEGGPWTAGGELDGGLDGGLLLFCATPRADAGDPPDAAEAGADSAGPPACPASVAGSEPCGSWPGYGACPPCPAGNACDAPLRGSCRATPCEADPVADSECSGVPGKPNAYSCASSDPAPLGCAPAKVGLGFYCCA